MNERIKELRRQAIDHCLDKGSQGNLSEEVAEKFAELIVKECAMIAREVGNNTETDDFALDRCYEIEDKIKQHFGVEE
jgi:hypothetical protein